MSEQILRINYAAVPVSVCDRLKGNNRQRFRCWLDGGSSVGPETGLRSPALDGARWLIGQGVSPDRLMNALPRLSRGGRSLCRRARKNRPQRPRLVW